MEDVEFGLRREAVRRRLAGESPEVIAGELGRTRQWVGSWTARYDPDDPGWARGRSHAARRVANRTDAEVEQQGWRCAASWRPTRGRRSVRRRSRGSWRSSARRCPPLRTI